MNKAAEQLNCRFHQQMVTRETQKNVRTGRGVSETWRQPDKISELGWVIPPVLYDFFEYYISDNLKQLKIMFLDHLIVCPVMLRGHVTIPVLVFVFTIMGTGRIKDSTAH